MIKILLLIFLLQTPQEAYREAYEKGQRALDRGELAHPALEASFAYNEALLKLKNQSQVNCMNIKEELRFLTKEGQKSQIRTKYGQELFNTTIKNCKEAAKNGDSFYDRNVVDIDVVQPEPHMLQDGERELYYRLLEAGLDVKLINSEQRSIGTGPYGEDEYWTDTIIRISW